MDHQIGARVLTEQMMLCSFSHTDAVLETIENIRNRAAEVHDEFEKALRESPNEAVMGARGYNNAISILGSRGSGKTSIIMTLQHILQVGKASWIGGSNPVKTNNIIMPILVPQDFTANQSLLSWVIIQLLEKAEQIEQEIAKNNTFVFGNRGPLGQWMSPSAQDYPVQDPLRECMDNLTSSFELRYKSENSLLRNDEQVYHYMDSVKRDSNLVLDMLKLISMMTDYYKSTFNYDNKDYNSEPLFVFCIDDLDLVPERSNEILKLVLRYLQHPNIVVLCGWNQELFQNHLSIDLLKGQGVLNSNMINTNFGFDDVFMFRLRKRLTALDSARRLAIDNLKKAFPPAQRYEIRGLTTKQRAFFPLQPNGNETVSEEKSFFKLIERTINSCINSDDKSVEHVRFLYNRVGEQLYVYMRIFDNKARGMINVYRAFENLLERVKAWNHDNPLDVTNYIKSLLDTILFSNTHFAPYRRGIRDLIQIDKIVLKSKGSRHSICEYYCNYKNIETVLKDYHKRIQQQYERNPIDAEYRIEREYNYFPSLLIDVFLLLNFVENFVRYISGNHPKEHGGNEFSTLLNQAISPISINTTSDDPLSQAILISGIRVIPLFPSTDDFHLNIELLDSYEKHGFMDRNYHFNGSYSYCRLFDAFFYLVSKKRYIDIDKMTELYNSVHDWFCTITKLFNCLRYSEYNVRRRLVLKSLLYQQLYESHEEILYTINKSGNLTSTNVFDVKKRVEHSVNDSDMDTLLECLRETDALRRRLNNFKTRRIRNSENSEEDNIVMQRAEVYIMFFGYLEDMSSDSWLDTKKLETSLISFKNYKIALSEKKDLNYTIIDNTMKLADSNILAFLSNLMQRLEAAVRLNYQKLSETSSQFSYLLDASKKIPNYLNRWELHAGQWTGTEEIACTTIRNILRQKGLTEQQRAINRIAQLGPDLSEGNREIYSISVGELRNWINNRPAFFTREELYQLNNNLKILAEAPSHIRRSLIIEDQVYEIIKTFGLELACKYAEIGLQLFLAEELDSIWPFTKQNRDSLQSWADQIDRISSLLQEKGIDNNKKMLSYSQRKVSTSTMFDVNHSNIELSLILRSEKDENK